MDAIFIYLIAINCWKSLAMKAWRGGPGHRMCPPSECYHPIVKGCFLCKDLQVKIEPVMMSSYHEPVIGSGGRPVWPPLIGGRDSIPPLPPVRKYMSNIRPENFALGKSLQYL